MKDGSSLNRVCACTFSFIVLRTTCTSNLNIFVQFYSLTLIKKSVTSFKMKVKVLTRNPDEYLRETKRDIHKSKYT